MNANQSPRTRDERRAAVEAELQERLRARVAAPRTDGLQCVACGRVSPLDARFCTQCGVQFNAIVVSPK